MHSYKLYCSEDCEFSNVQLLLLLVMGDCISKSLKWLHLIFNGNKFILSVEFKDKVVWCPVMALLCCWFLEQVTSLLLLDLLQFTKLDLVSTRKATYLPLISIGSWKLSGRQMPTAFNFFNKWMKRQVGFILPIWIIFYGVITVPSLVFDTQIVFHRVSTHQRLCFALICS